MNFVNPCGDSSSKTQENSDTSATDERPLKKARFAWQVKGKYHLKTKDNGTDNVQSRISERNQVVNNLNDNDVCAAGTSKGVSSDIVNCEKFDISKCNKSRKHSLGERRLTKGLMVNIIPDVGTSNSSYSDKNIVLTKATCSTMHLNNTFNAEKRKRLIPVSMVKRKSRKDAMLAKWQAKQIATAFVDNTINSVLDSWVAAPLSSSGRLENDVGFRAEEFLDILPRRCSVENEGILMAISRHGLRNNCVEASSTHQHEKLFGDAESLSTSTSSSRHPVPNGASGGNNNSPQIRSPKHTDIFREENTCSDTKIKSQNNALCSNSEQAEPKAWRGLAEPCVCSHSVRTGFTVNEVRPVIPFHKRVRATTEAEQFTEIETNSLYIKTAGQNSPSWTSKNMKTVKSEVNNEKSACGQSNNEFADVDFMDAALACAIQDKGLSSFDFN